MTINPRRTHAAVALLLLASCETPPPAPPRPAPPPPATVARPVLPPPPRALPPAPQRAVDWRDMALPAGDWVFARTATGSLARYGEPRAVPLASLMCNRQAREVSLVLPGSPAGTGPWPAEITAATATATLAAEAFPAAGVPAVAIRFAADSRTLDAMAFSRGRFRVAVAGLAPIALPAWSEVGRVVEDCRAGDAARNPDTDNK